MSKIKLLLDVVEDIRSLADSIQAVADAMLQNETGSTEVENDVPQKNEAPAKPKKTISLEQVRAVLAQKSHEGLTAEVRTLLQKYGASKLSEIDPEYYEGLLAEAEELVYAPK